jgi:hypothetical protein
MVLSTQKLPRSPVSPAGATTNRTPHRTSASAGASIRWCLRILFKDAKCLAIELQVASVLVRQRADVSRALCTNYLTSMHQLFTAECRAHAINQDVSIENRMYQLHRCHCSMRQIAHLCFTVDDFSGQASASKYNYDAGQCGIV